jgi:hypothetical protein
MSSSYLLVCLVVAALGGGSCTSSPFVLHCLLQHYCELIISTKARNPNTTGSNGRAGCHPTDLVHIHGHYAKRAARATFCTVEGPLILARHRFEENLYVYVAVSALLLRRRRRVRTVRRMD